MTTSLLEEEATVAGSGQREQPSEPSQGDGGNRHRHDLIENPFDDSYQGDVATSITKS